MSIAGKDLNTINEQDLQDLIDFGVPESVVLEYKRDDYGHSDEQKKEFLKNVTAFANTDGGHLIIGIEENKGLASNICQMPEIDPDAVLQRYENLISSCIEPRVFGIRMCAVPVRDGYLIVIRIPKSWHPPHRVSFKNSNRFYRRDSARAYEASVDELRVLFTSSSTVQDRIRAFRAERLGRIEARDTPSKLLNEPCIMVLHLVPLSAYGFSRSIDLEKAKELVSELSFIGRSGGASSINIDGLIRYSGQRAYLQLYRSGVIESVFAGACQEESGKLLISIAEYEKKFRKAIIFNLKAMERLGVAPPIIAMLSMIDIRGAYPYIDEDYLDDDDQLAITGQSRIELPELVFEFFGDTVMYTSQMRPAFDALWNGAGYAKSPSYNENGDWIAKT